MEISLHFTRTLVRSESSLWAQGHCHAGTGSGLSVPVKGNCYATAYKDILDDPICIWFSSGKKSGENLRTGQMVKRPHILCYVVFVDSSITDVFFTLNALEPYRQSMLSQSRSFISHTPLPNHRWLCLAKLAKAPVHIKSQGCSFFSHPTRLSHESLNQAGKYSVLTSLLLHLVYIYNSWSCRRVSFYKSPKYQNNPFWDRVHPF